LSDAACGTTSLNVDACEASDHQYDRRYPAVRAAGGFFEIFVVR
jgi:hypothetical protein